jgi:hypothetical protein
MRRLSFLALVVAALAAFPAAAFADDHPGDSQNQAQSPAQRCQEQRTSIGVSALNHLYGTNANKANALGKCVAKLAAGEASGEQNAAQTCKAERADANFASSHGGKAFEQFYGTGKNGANAFGKCVSSKAGAASEEQDHSTVNAAKSCRSEQLSDPAAFKAKYGTNEREQGERLRQVRLCPREGVKSSGGSSVSQRTNELLGEVLFAAGRAWRATQGRGRFRRQLS